MTTLSDLILTLGEMVALEYALDGGTMILKEKSMIQPTPDAKVVFDIYQRKLYWPYRLELIVDT